MNVSQPVNGGESSSDSTQSSEKDKTSAMSDKQTENRETSDSEQRYEEYQGDISKTEALSAFGRGHNPASQANLKPFEKGTSGNPSGRPVENAKFIEALRKYGYDVPRDIFGDKEPLSQVTNNMAVIDQIWKDAKKGRFQAIRLLIELGAIEPDTSE